jgi:hypothetical protein
VGGSQVIKRTQENYEAEWEDWRKDGSIKRTGPSTYYIYNIFGTLSVMYYAWASGPANRSIERGFLSFRTGTLTVLAATLYVYYQAAEWESGKERIDTVIAVGKDEVDNPSLGANGAAAEWAATWGYSDYVGQVLSTDPVGAWYSFPLELDWISTVGWTDFVLRPVPDIGTTHGGRMKFSTVEGSYPAYLLLTIEPLRTEERVVGASAGAALSRCASGVGLRTAEAGAREAVGSSGSGIVGAEAASTVKRASTSTVEQMVVSGAGIRRLSKGTREPSAEKGVSVRRAAIGTETVLLSTLQRDVGVV